jgi:hypothetical protein
MGSRRYRGRGGRHLTVGRNARAPYGHTAHADVAMDPRRALRGPTPGFDFRDATRPQPHTAIVSSTYRKTISRKFWICRFPEVLRAFSPIGPCEA